MQNGICLLCCISILQFGEGVVHNLICGHASSPGCKAKTVQSVQLNIKILNSIYDVFCMRSSSYNASHSAWKEIYIYLETCSWQAAGRWNLCVTDRPAIWHGKKWTEIGLFTHVRLSLVQSVATLSDSFGVTIIYIFAQRQHSPYSPVPSSVPGSWTELSQKCTSVCQQNWFAITS